MTSIGVTIRKLVLPIVYNNVVRQYVKYDGVRQEKGSLCSSYRPLLGLEKSEISTSQLIENLTKKHFVVNTNHLEMWSSLETDALQNARGITAQNFDGIMMIFLKKKKMYEKAQSFLNYLNSSRTPNDVVLANFMVLAADCKDETKALEAYEKINKSLLVVPSMVKLVVQGLSKTSKWKHCLELVSNLNEVHVPVWIEVAAAAFKNGDREKGMQFVNEIVDSGFEPRTNDFSAWLQIVKYCTNRNDAGWLMDKFFECLRRTEHLLSLENALTVKQIMQRWFHMTVSSVTMEETGVCPSCGTKLERPQLTPEQHQELQQVFFKERVLQGSTTHQESHPKELSFFLRFLERAKPFDVVVDALNVAHKQKGKQPAQLAQQLLDVVSQLREQNYSPLVLGRKHVWYWNTRIIGQVEQLAKCFYADNISSDDSFMIFAALYGGPGTLIMTSDMLRNHQFQLDDKTQELFHRWVTSRKVFFNCIGAKMEIKHHQLYGIYAQGSWTQGWHVPYEQYEPYKPQLPFWKQRLHWLCCQTDK